jgi:ribosomal protein S12 methylthiotransferase
MEAKYLSSKGITEINVISQDTTRYGSDINSSLAELLDALANLNKFKLIRVLYLYPDEITQELLDVMKKHNSIANYFDIPIQHASDKMLHHMNRRGNQELITNIINNIRSMMSDAIIRTTLIVGFPGEDENDFNILKDYVYKMHFDRLGVFQYSDEENTVAYDFDNKISDDVKLQRFEEIMEIQYQVIEDNNKLLLGKTFEALVDHFDNRKQMFALRSYREAPDEVDGYIYVKDSLEIGKYYNIEITDYKGYDLFGKIKSTN